MRPTSLKSLLSSKKNEKTLRLFAVLNFPSMSSESRLCKEILAEDFGPYVSVQTCLNRLLA
jgi:hypothetical protein